MAFRPNCYAAVGTATPVTGSGGTITRTQKTSITSVSTSPVTGENPQASAQLRNAISALSCSPGTVPAGGQVACELRVAASAVPRELLLGSSSDRVKIPATAVTRANQSRLTFQANVAPDAGQQPVTLTAMLDGAAVEHTIHVVPAAGPVLTVPGKQFGKFGSPVRFTVAARDPAGLPVQLTAAGVPAGASFDPGSGRFEWVPGASQAGKYPIAFGAINSARQSSSAPVVIEVDSGLSVLDSAERFACSPGSAASLTGKWLAAAGDALSDPSGSVMDLGGTRVKINGQYVPMLFSSATQVNFLCPALDPGTQLLISVESASGLSEPLIAIMQAASPAILSLDGSGRNQGLISFAGAADLAMVRNFRVPAHPAQPGDRILIWATGLGSAAGAATGRVLVKLGDVDTEAESVQAVSGHAGMYTIQTRIPSSMTFGDAVSVQLAVAAPDGREFNSNTVTATIEPVAQ